MRRSFAVRSNSPCCRFSFRPIGRNSPEILSLAQRVRKCSPARVATASASESCQAQGTDGIFLEDQVMDFRLEPRFAEIFDPPIRSDQRKVGTEQHFTLQLRVRVL